MARYQYRLTGVQHAHSQSGSALLAITNNANSGHKITINSLEINNLGGASVSATTMNLRVAREYEYGHTNKAMQYARDVTPVPLDSTAPDWVAATQKPRLYFGEMPSSNILWSGLESRTLGRFQAQNVMPVGTAVGALASQSAIGRFRGLKTRRSVAAVESWIAYDGATNAEAAGLVLEVEAPNNSFSWPGYAGPVRINVLLRWYDSESNTTSRWAASAQLNCTALSATALMWLGFDGPGGTTSRLYLEEVSVTTWGSLDTPFLQLVPIAGVRENFVSDTLKQLSPFAMDSASPAFTAGKIYSDVGVAPITGVESDFSEASAGSPKGFNYLQTKDFIGPVYRTQFPEAHVRMYGNLSLPFGWMNYQDMLTRGAGITIRPGEAIALCSAAETAAGATAAVGTSGWMPLEYSVSFSVEPVIIPTLTLTGLKNPSEVRIYPAGSQTSIAGQENVTGGSYSTQIDPDTITAVDITILSLGYQNMRLLNIPIGTTDVTIPVSQVIDRQYANP